MAIRKHSCESHLVVRVELTKFAFDFALQQIWFQVQDACAYMLVPVGKRLPPEMTALQLLPPSLGHELHHLPCLLHACTQPIQGCIRDVPVGG